MFDFRSPVILWAAPTGLVLAALVWLATQGATYTQPVSTLEAELRRPTSTGDRVAPPDLSQFVGRIVSSPLFALTTGPGAVTETQLQLQGVAITPNGKSALLSVDGKPASWYDVGATRDGATVVAIERGRAVVDTATALKTAGLLDKPASVGQAASQAAQPSSSLAPTGFRSPPAPASAPGATR